MSLKYMPPQNPKNKQRKRRLTWYNPPFCRSLKTKIGSEFLKWVEACFPKSHPLSKIINKNTIKVSPSCMPNIGAKIASLNKQKLTPPPLLMIFRAIQAVNADRIPAP